MSMRLEKELILYVIFGILTTLVNIAAYLFLVRVLNINYLISNVLAWFFSVLFAYVTNKIWVFESRNTNIIKEISLFFGGRIFSGVVDTGMMYLMIDILTIDDVISKIFIQVVVVILNYVISKMIVFKK